MHTQSYSDIQMCTEEKNPDNAPGQLNRIIKRQKRSPIGEATIRDMMIHKKSFLVLDWPLRAVNSKGSTKTFQMMVNEQGWTNIEERSYYGSSEQVSSPNDTLNIISRLQSLDQRVDGFGARKASSKQASCLGTQESIQL